MGVANGRRTFYDFVRLNLILFVELLCNHLALYKLGICSERILINFRNHDISLERCAFKCRALADDLLCKHISIVIFDSKFVFLSHTFQSLIYLFTRHVAKSSHHPHKSFPHPFLLWDQKLFCVLGVFGEFCVFYIRHFPKILWPAKNLCRRAECWIQMSTVSVRN